MPLTRVLPLWISIVISLIAPLSGSPAQSTPKLLTIAQWTADLKFLAETLPVKFVWLSDGLFVQAAAKA